MGFKSNFMRYGYDFVPVDADGEMVQGDPSRNENHVGFGAPVRASGDGVVVALENGQPDNRQSDQSKIPQDPMVLFGNHVLRGASAQRLQRATVDTGQIVESIR